MSTFLELCQKVAVDSRTISGAGQPASVVNQTGRLGRIVRDTAEAWNIIQNNENNWRWMRKEFSGPITQSTAKYTPASFSLTRFARWIDEKDTMTLYDTALGVADEGAIDFITWDQWRRTYGRGAQDENRPTKVAITPAEELAFGAIPNMGYTVRGEYIRSEQILVDDGDIPEMPARFHRVIVDRTLMLLSEGDEAIIQVGSWRDNYDNKVRNLMRDQLPEITLGGGPIA